MKLKSLSLWTVPLLIGLTPAERAHAWGQYGHEQVNDAAMEIIGKKNPLGACLNKNERLIQRYSITPDMEWKGMVQIRDLSEDDRVKRAQNDKEEHPLHFFERDAYFSNGKEAEGLAKIELSEIFPVLKTLLSQNSERVKMLDPSKPLADPKNPSDKDVLSHGTAPWRIVQLYRLGVQAIKDRDMNLALLYLGTLGHYVGDMSMPFHTTLNYDGKGSTPPLRGIHEAVDTLDLPTKGKDNSSLYPNFDATEVPVLSAANRIYDSNRNNPLKKDQIVSEVYALIDSGYPLVDTMLTTYAKYSSLADSRSMPTLESSTPSDRSTSSDRRRMSTNSLSPRGATGIEPSARHTRNKVKRMPADLIRGFARDVIMSVNERLGASAALLARLWEAAYAEAGKPDLGDQCDGLTFDQSYAIQNYPSPSDYIKLIR